MEEAVADTEQKAKEANDYLEEVCVCSVCVFLCMLFIFDPH